MSTDEIQSNPPASYPDPLFKVVTRLEAQQVGIIATESELQYTKTTRGDLLLEVPPGISLKDTLFDFFRVANVLEFKSENDQFDLDEYIRNDTRVNQVFLQHKDLTFADILNVFVVSRKPQGFLKIVQKRRIKFQAEAGKPWLLQGEVGFQDVAIVVCKDLPLERRYYNWLAFAPTDSPKWRRLVIRLLIEESLSGRETDLALSIESMRPKEYSNMARIFREAVERAKRENWLTPEEFAQIEEMENASKPILRQIRAELYNLDPALIEILYETADDQKAKKLRELLASLKPGERLAGLGPEERLAGLSPEERLAGLGPEERLAGLGPEERQEMIKLLTEQAKEEKQ